MLKWSQMHTETFKLENAYGQKLNNFLFQSSLVLQIRHLYFDFLGYSMFEKGDFPFCFISLTMIIRVFTSTSKNSAVPLCCTAAQSHTAAYSSSASIEKLFKSIYFSSKVTLALNFKVKLMANSVWHWSPKIMISMFLSKNVRKKLLTFLSQNHDFWKWPFQKIMEKCKSKSFSVSHQ